VRRILLVLVVVALTLAAVPPVLAKPKPPAPHVGGAGDSPPPAWIHTAHGDRWLAYSTYCWKTVCADYIHPAQRDDLPRIVVGRREVVRFHFGFRPSGLMLEVGGKSYDLVDAKAVSWRVRRGGVLTLSMGGSGGDASYAARLVVR
jgi:hypothetical protein